MSKHTRYILAFAVLITCYSAGNYLASRAQSLPDLDRVIDQRVDRASQGAAERAQERASERALTNASDAAAERLLQRQTSQASEVAAERARQQGIERIGGQAEEVARRRAEAGSQAQSSLESVRDRLRGVVSQQPNTAEQAVAQADRRASRGRATQSPGRAVGQAAGLLPPLPERLEIGGPGGGTVYVEIEISPGIRAIEREWIILVNPEQRQQLFSDAPELIPFLTGSTDFGVLNSEVLTFAIPPDLDADGAVLELLPVNLRPLMDRNHVYQVQNQSSDSSANLVEKEQPAGAFPLATPMASVCEEPVTVGMIDSAIHTGHAVFQNLTPDRLQIQRFMAPELVSPVNHGTAVASVLIGDDSALGPLLPNATVYSATAVHGQDRYRQGATALNLMRATAWLIEQDVSVINISLTGPENRVLERVLGMAMANNVAIVAAAGNNGAHSPPVYPAAYPGVTAVTAVDRNGDIYRWANQGEHVEFAALGVDLPVARSDGTIGRLSGTSLAAPIVSAYLACAIAHASGDVRTAYQEMQSESIDRGEPGHDNVFGFGVLHPHPALIN